MKYLLLLLFSASLFMAGCTTCCKNSTDATARFTVDESTSIREARELIKSGRAECVLVKNGKIALIESGHGVSPLLNLYEKHGDEMTNGIIVDKVIGRAAAAIAICGHIRHVHGEVMSEDAVVFLKNNGITASSTLLVPRILNQKRDGLCPLEKSVEGITSPQKALTALKRKIASFKKGSHSGKQ